MASGALILQAEVENFRAAHAWYVSQHDTESALRLITALKEVWWLVGAIAGPRRDLADGLAAATGINAVVHCRALILAAEIEAACGQVDDAERLARQALDIAVAGHDLPGIAHATEKLGLIAEYLGQIDAARDILLDAAARHRAVGDRHRLGRTLSRIAMLGGLSLISQSGPPADLASRVNAAEEALDLFRSGGHAMAMPKALVALGFLARIQKDYSRAETLFKEALALRWEQHNLWEIDEALAFLAGIDHLNGNAIRATQSFGAVIANQTKLGTVGASTDPQYDGHLPENYHGTYRIDLGALRAALGDVAFDDAFRAGLARPLAEILSEILDQPASAAASAERLTSGPGAGFAIPLSPREVEVLRLVAAGGTNATVADALYLSPATVKRHVTNILAKLGVPTRADAIAYAFRNGLAR